MQSDSNSGFGLLCTLDVESERDGTRRTPSLKKRGRGCGGVGGSRGSTGYEAEGGPGTLYVQSSKRIDNEVKLNRFEKKNNLRRGGRGRKGKRPELRRRLEGGGNDFRIRGEGRGGVVKFKASTSISQRSSMRVRVTRFYSAILKTASR